MKLGPLPAALAAVFALRTAAGEPPKGPTPKIILLEPGDKDYLPLLGGPPETASMRSGLVTLAPGKAVGAHSTGRNEEMLVPLTGSGELRIEGRAPIAIRSGLVTYTPAHTRHDVVNTGTGPLRYIYVVARAE
ncbi:MAG TPA: cupin domain-containing protein [Thermoanaerobaculia bacterium]|nr:cupin domain-containing protein [Thermoanaerobaculia bacterium]